MWSAAGRKRRWNAVRRPISGPISAAVDMPWPIVPPGRKKSSRCAAAGFWAWISRGWTCCSAETAPLSVRSIPMPLWQRYRPAAGWMWPPGSWTMCSQWKEAAGRSLSPVRRILPGNETPGRPPRGGRPPSASSRGLRTAALISPGPGICLSFHTSNAPKAPRGRKTWMAINPKCARWGPDDMDKAVKK